MNATVRKTVLVAGMSLIVCLAGSCRQQGGWGSRELVPMMDLGPTIGSLGVISLPQAIPVSGYGLVGGLRGTGSAQCPPQIRAYLVRYILKQLPERRRLDVEGVIDSPETAVVLVEGMIPVTASKGHRIDLMVTALPGTQTTSLDGGWLFGTELKIPGNVGMTTKTIVEAKGPVFMDKISTSRINERVGHVLAGGEVLEEYRIALVLKEPDFATTSNVRNCLNERFGAGTAKAVVPGRIELTVPAKYAEQKQRFISMVEATYLTHGLKITQERIRMHVRELVALKNKYASEVALEAIGNESLEKLGVLLSSADERVRLHAARCMLNLGSDAGLEPLREIALDKNSRHRIEAMESITLAARRNDASAILRRLLRDDDFQIRLAAYEQLRRLEDMAVAQESIAGNFYLERIMQTDRKTVYVSRSGQPRIVLFGSPIYCSGNVFVGSADGDITINAPSGQQYVTIIRKNPKRPSVIAQLRSSFELGDIISALCEEPTKEGSRERGGLGVSYSDMIVLLKQMCDKGAVRAEFRAGPLPKIG